MSAPDREFTKMSPEGISTPNVVLRLVKTYRLIFSTRESEYWLSHKVPVVVIV